MRAILFGAALVLAACASDDPNDPNDPGDPGDPNDPTPPDQEARDYDDVATSIGAALYAGELSAMVDAVTISMGGFPAGFTQTSAMTMVGERNGVSIEYFYHCNDSNDVIIGACTEQAHHLHLHLTMTGALSSPMSLTGVTREGDWTVRDLLVDKPRVGGDGQMTYVTTLEGGTYAMTYDATFDRVRFQPDGALPYEGAINLAVQIHREREGVGERDFSVAANIVFSSATTATMILDATRNYSIDLATGAVVKL